MREYLFPYYRRWTAAQEEASRLRARLEDAEQLLSMQQEVTGPDLETFLDQVEANYKALTNPFRDYVELIDGLLEMRGVKLLPLYELAGAHDENAVLVGMRHDIDADPVNAVRMARHLARVGVCGSFYLLHTALYYGRFEGRIFVRSPEIPRWIRAMIVAGCEIGIHNDALGVSRQGLDGALALEREITFLRSLGAVIRGTVGHNSLPVYGAENAEVFAGRQLWRRRLDLPDWLGRTLEALDEAQLGLSYEGSFAAARAECDIPRAEAFAGDLASASVRSESWMWNYLVDNPSIAWTVDVQVWVIGRNEWVVAGRVAGAEIWHWCVSQQAMLDVVASLPLGSRCLFVLHPEYFRG